MSDGFKIALPKSGETVSDKLSEIVQTFVDSGLNQASASSPTSAINTPNSVWEFSMPEFGVFVGLPAFCIGLAVAFFLCGLCIPGNLKKY